MKAMGIILIFLSGVFTTAVIAGKYIKRADFLKMLISDFELLKNEILFKRSTLYEGFLNLCEKGKLKSFYKKIPDSLKAGIPLTECLVSSFSDTGYFESCDLRALSDFGKLSGESDAEGQLRAFDNLISELKENLKVAEKNKAEKLKPSCAAVLFGFTALGLFLI